MLLRHFDRIVFQTQAHQVQDMEPRTHSGLAQVHSPPLMNPPTHPHFLRLHLQDEVHSLTLMRQALDLLSLSEEIRGTVQMAALTSQTHPLCYLERDLRRYP